MAVILPGTQTAPVTDAVPGGFWIALGASFGYTAGWNPYAADYSRYLPPAKRAGIFAALGVACRRPSPARCSPWPSGSRASWSRSSRWTTSRPTRASCW